MAEDPIGGYVKFYRRLTQNPVWSVCSPAVLKVFTACLFLANWRDSEWYDGVQMVAVPRGSFVTSLRRLAGYSNLTLKQIRGALEHLNRLEITKSLGAHAGAHGWTMISVCNYDTYQGSEDKAGHTVGPFEGTQKGTIKGTQKGNSLRREEVEQERIQPPTPFAASPLVLEALPMPPPRKKRDQKPRKEKLSDLQKPWFSRYAKLCPRPCQFSSAEKLFGLEIKTEADADWICGEVETYVRQSEPPFQGMHTILEEAIKRRRYGVSGNNGAALISKPATRPATQQTFAERNAALRNEIFRKDTLEKIGEQF